MSKNIGELTPRTEEILKRVKDDLQLTSGPIEIYAVGVFKKKCKDLVKVYKSKDSVEYVHKCKNSVIVEIDEFYFEKLEDEQCYMLLWDELRNITYDYEKDTVKIEGLKFTAYVNSMEKFGDEYIRLKQAITIDKSKKEDDE